MQKKIAALVAAVAILASIRPAEAQTPAKVRKVGFLAQGGGPGVPVELLRQGLRGLGWVEGQNLVIEYRSAEARSRLAELAAELVREKVDVIVAQGPAAGPAKMATTVIPIVFGYSGDPIEAGYIVSLARPGGNMTGITWLAFELVGKRLELLKEAAPGISRVAVLANPAHPGEQRELKETQNAAQTLGTTLQYHQVRTGGDFDTAFDAIAKGHANALLVFPDALTSAHRKQVAEFAVKHRLASMFGRQEAVEAGGLISYGPDQSDAYRRMAVYVDKILKGAKPADLPAELPRKFELVINLKTAKQIGVTIPQSMLYRADKVIK
ncbi:MAG: ABC transporter substrate-binding protein [Candidatus Binatia bacterium]